MSAWHALFPPPRRPVSWRSFAPLAAFLGAFGAACVAAEIGGLVLFTRLWPFALLSFAPWIWWLHLAGGQPLSRARAGLAVLSRLLLLALLVATLADPHAVRRDERLAVVFAVDHSASIQRAASDQAMRFVLGTTAGKAEADEAGLVFFGRNAAVELPPATALPYESINVDVDRDGTDLAAALALSASVLPAERQARVVLVSDGVATQGSLLPVLDDLAARGVTVDVLPVEYQTEHEAWLERLELPPRAKVGETMEPVVILESLQAGEGTLTLEQNGQRVAEHKVTFTAGKNRFSLPVVLPAPGYYEFAARLTLSAGADRWERNNVALAALNVEGKGRILLVTDPGGSARDAEFVAAALRQQQREVVPVAAPALPRDPLALLPYDCIVFVNAPRDAFDEAQLAACHDAVFHQGSGFLMVGGGQSFGPGGWHRSPVEDLLPVSMDMSQRKVMPKGALAIVLHTCEFPEGNTWGKRITQQAIKVLDPRDDVGVVAHGMAGDYWVAPMSPAADYEKLARLVNAADIGDMLGFDAPMAMAFTALQASDASTRHLIVISDCDPSPPTPQLVAQYQALKVSISTVAVFPHGASDIPRMQALSAATGGRFYQPSDPAALPAIFVKEAKTLRRSAVQNRTFTPTLLTTSPILKGIDALPPLHGYVLTSPKARAITILEGPEAEDQDPVLARWRYGVGAAAAFTSDLCDNWAREWVAWQRFQPFVTQLVTDLCRAETRSRLTARCFAARGEGLVVVEDHGEAEELLDLAATVQGPGGASTLHLEQVAPRRYEAHFPLAGVGRYRTIVADAGARPDPDAPGAGRAFAGFTIAYGQEYLRFRSDPITLQEIASRTGGRVLRGDEDAKVVFAHDRAARRSSRSIVDWLLMLLAFLIPIDVGLRRVQLDWAVIRGLFARKQSASEQTLGALLARKEKADASIAAARAAAAPRERAPASPPPTSTTTTTTAPSAPARPPAPARPGAPPSGAPSSTAERLLAAKRRSLPPRPPPAPPPAP